MEYNSLKYCGHVHHSTNGQGTGFEPDTRYISINKVVVHMKWNKSSSCNLSYCIFKQSNTLAGDNIVTPHPIFPFKTLSTVKWILPHDCEQIFAFVSADFSIEIFAG